MTTPSLLPPLTPTAERVNNKITFSADEWRENAIKGGVGGEAIQHDAQDGVLFITRAGVAPSRINHHTCSFCQRRHENVAPRLK